MSPLHAPAEALILRGWGDTPRERIPLNWQDVAGPNRAVLVDVDGHLMAFSPLMLEGLPTPKGDMTAGSKLDQDAACVLFNARQRAAEARGTPRVPRIKRTRHRRFFDRPEMQQRAAEMRKRNGRSY